MITGRMTQFDILRSFAMASTFLLCLVFVGCFKVPEEIFDAAINGKNKVIEDYLDMGGDIDATSEFGSTMLSLAAVYGHEELVVFLLKKGAAIEIKNDSGKTATWRAAASGQKKIVKILVEAGANIKGPGSSWDHGIIEISVLGKTEDIKVPPIVDYLTEKGADINHQDKGKKTALHWAVYRKFPITLNHLLDLGADPNLTDVNGYNVLMLYMWEPDIDIDIVKRLAPLTKDLTAKSFEGKTAADIARDNGHEKVANYLAELQQERKTGRETQK